MKGCWAVQDDACGAPARVFPHRRATRGSSSLATPCTRLRTSSLSITSALPPAPCKGIRYSASHNTLCRTTVWSAPRSVGANGKLELDFAIDRTGQVRGATRGCARLRQSSPRNAAAAAAAILCSRSPPHTWLGTPSSARGFAAATAHPWPRRPSRRALTRRCCNLPAALP